MQPIYQSAKNCGFKDWIYMGGKDNNESDNILLLKLRTYFSLMHLENSIHGNYSVVKVPLLCCLKL